MTDFSQENREEKQPDTAKAKGDQVGGDKIGQQINTDGGTVYTGPVTAERDFIGRDQYKIFLPGELQPVFVGVPPMPPHFVGRDDIAQDLIEQLASDNRSVLSIEGLPGVGKTTLAVALAHHREILEHFKDGVLWAGLGPEAKVEDIIGILNRWADALNIDVTSKPVLRDRKQVLEDAIGQKSLLIVVDDAWDYAVAKHLRFGNLKVGHLLTTRDKDIASQFVGVGGMVVGVPTLKDDPASQLLQKLAPEAFEANPEVVLALAKSVGGLPLALELLGGYLALPRHKLRPKLSKKALDELMDPHRRLQLAQERLGGSGREETLHEAIMLSIEGLRELEIGEELERAFYALGSFAPKPEQFSWEAAEVVAGTEIEELVIRNLVEMADDQLVMHQLMTDVAKFRMDDAALTHHRNYYLNLVNENREDWQLIEGAYGQIKWAWSRIDEEDCLNWIWALRHYQSTRGLLRDYIAWQKRGLMWARASDRPKDEATLLVNLGWAHRAMGQQGEALRRFEEALPIWREVNDHAGEAATLNNIGEVYRESGRLSEALQYFEDLLPIRRAREDKVGEATTLNNMGMVYIDMENQVEALKRFEEALPIWREVNDHAGEAATLNNIGVLYRLSGRLQEALRQFEEALPIWRIAGDRAGEVRTLWHKAIVLDQLEDPLEAINIVNEAIEIFRVGLTHDAASNTVEKYEALLEELQAQNGN